MNSASPFHPRPRKNSLPTYEELSPQQDQIMRLPAEGRYLIKGSPGTGKTVMALLRAASLIKRKKAVLYILYYRLLRTYCCQLWPGEIRSYHAWIGKHFGAHYGQTMPKVGQWAYDWQKIMDICWKKYPDGNKDKDTYIIIDEGQDMPQGFYEYLDFHFENILVSADENQQMTIGGNNANFKNIKGALSLKDENVFELRKNYRNTHEIAEFCKQFYTGAGAGPPEPPDNTGIKPILVRHQKEKEDKLAEIICRRLKENPHQLVAIVPYNKKAVAKWKERIRENGIVPWVYSGDQSQLNQVDFKKGGLILTNFHNIKGLEFDRLYVPALRDHYFGPTFEDETRMNLYVLCSRPKDILVLLENVDQGADKILPIVNQKASLLNIKNY